MTRTFSLRRSDAEETPRLLSSRDQSLKISAITPRRRILVSRCQAASVYSPPRYRGRFLAAQTAWLAAITAQSLTVTDPAYDWASLTVFLAFANPRPIFAYACDISDDAALTHTVNFMIRPLIDLYDPIAVATLQSIWISDPHDPPPTDDASRDEGLIFHAFDDHRSSSFLAHILRPSDSPPILMPWDHSPSMIRSRVPYATTSDPATEETDARGTARKPIVNCRVPGI